MGLIAFCAFILPWGLVALWLFRLPSALRANLPPTPWRPLTDYQAPGDGTRREPRDGTRREPATGPSPVTPLADPAPIAPRTTLTGEPVH